MKISHEELCDKLAHALTDAVDMDTLVESFWELQYEYFKKEATDEQLREMAEDLAIWHPEDDGPLEIE